MHEHWFESEEEDPIDLLDALSAMEDEDGEEAEPPPGPDASVTRALLLRGLGLDTDGTLGHQSLQRRWQEAEELDAESFLEALQLGGDNELDGVDSPVTPADNSRD